jgi:hypothetical protein
MSSIVERIWVACLLVVSDGIETAGGAVGAKGGEALLCCPYTFGWSSQRDVLLPAFAREFYGTAPYDEKGTISSFFCSPLILFPIDDSQHHITVVTIMNDHYHYQHGGDDDEENEVEKNCVMTTTTGAVDHVEGETTKKMMDQKEDFRNYSSSTNTSTADAPVQQRVLAHYTAMRKYQTVNFYRRMEQKYSFANGQYRRIMTIAEAFTELEHYVVCICCWIVFSPLSLARPVCLLFFWGGWYKSLIHFLHTINQHFSQDASDPDLDLPNKMHLLQTAEGIRRAGYVSCVNICDDAFFDSYIDV